MRPSLWKQLRQWLLAVACGVVLTGSPASAWAVTPDSPVVQQILAKAVKYLETASHDQLGGKCLIGMVFVKQGHKDDHPQVAEAVKACQAVCAKPAKEIAETPVYSTGIATIFLCELDSDKYRSEIATLLQALEQRQRSHGGWGYPDGHPHSPTGDTSMTQYAVLATWTAARSGHSVSQKSVERVCNWLLRTQDPSGGFGYQGIDPGEGKYDRVAQKEIKLSLSAAGAGSLYICADLLKFKVIDLEEKQATGLPPALEPVEEGQAKEPVTRVVPAKALTKGLNDANGWMRRNYKIDQGGWNLYYLYGLERYQSFRELAENLQEAEPKWYNDGVAYLKKAQGDDGAWELPSPSAGKAVDTAFGALFLMRSTKKTILKTQKRLSDGQLTGGRGLPSNAAAATVKHGKIIDAAAASAQIDDLVAVLEQGEGSSFEYLSNNPEEFTLSADEKVRQQQVLRLRRLVRASEPEARLLAVRALGRSRDFDSVPELLYALSDPDARVVREADAALRFFARRFGASALPDKLTEEDKQAAVKAWSQWYAGLRPEVDVRP